MNEHVLGDFAYSLCEILESSSFRKFSGKDRRQILHKRLRSVGNSFDADMLDFIGESSTFPKLFRKDQQQILYEGLRSLGNILKKQPNSFDADMLDFIRISLCDAGIVIFSLFPDAIEDGLAKEMECPLSDVLERIKHIKANAALSLLNFPKVDQLGFIDFLIENLRELTSEDGPMTLPKRQIQTIREELLFLRARFEKMTELCDKPEQLQGLLDRVVEFAYRVEFLVDVVQSFRNFYPNLFESITAQIKIIKLDALKVFDEKCLDIEVKNVAKGSNHLPSEESMPVIKDDIVVLDDEVSAIMGRLKRGANQLQIVTIAGMAGVGKTTLAKTVYNEPSIVSHFHIHAWCCVSQVYNLKELLLKILTCILGKLSDNYFEKSVEDLALTLYQSLKRMRYLIVLDDVWDIDAWNSLEKSFPNDANGSRILLTSRHLNVAPKDKLDAEPHSLRKLTVDESWKLLKAKLYPKDDWPSTFHEKGEQIVEWCQGLPLTIVILAGILATTEQDGWVEVIERLCLSTMYRMEQCKNILELSYRHLPDKLKPCFLYFGAFPQDQELTTKKLTSLWIAEGFVRKPESKNVEDEAKDYLRQLISRSLVMVAKRSSIGWVKTCHIHDLLHEFCVEKAKDERFFQLLQGSDERSGFNNLRRLCIYSPNCLIESRLFCPQVRSLLLFDHIGANPNVFSGLSLIIGSFKLVKVLELSQIFLGTFPSEIELLFHLRYLAILGRFIDIPSSITKLSNLETFVMHSSVVLILPDNIWNLKKLRHLYVKDNFFLGSFIWPVDNLDNSAELCTLETCSIAIHPGQNLQRIMRKFPNIRKLKCSLVASNDPAMESEENLVLEFISQLEIESLALFHNCGKPYQVECCFPLKLRKLTLSRLHWPWHKISAIGNLPNLEVLKLLNEAFVGQVWNMEDATQFPRLRFLKLASVGIVMWTATESETENHLPCLATLVLDNCYRLEEVPSCLGNIATLEMIEVSRCTDSALRSIKEIEEEQQSMGNEDLKVKVTTKRGKR